ncbi:hypothetical protein QTP88_028878 [Uroleucon formosanum]
MPPVDLIAEERARIKARGSEDLLSDDSPPTRITIKKEERRTTIAGWQRRWKGTIKASWTRRIIPSITRWVNRTTPRTQQSTQSSIVLIGKVADLNSGNAWVDLQMRQIFPDIMCGPVSVFENLPTDEQEKVAALNEAKESFRLFYKMVKDILTLKEIEERARQATDNAVNG